MRYNGRYYRTTTKVDAGKHAEYDEHFYLDGALCLIAKQDVNSYLLFEAYDEDLTEAEFLCGSKPFPLFQIYERCRGRAVTSGEEGAVVTENLPLYDARKRQFGTVDIAYSVIARSALNALRRPGDGSLPIIGL